LSTSSTFEWEKKLAELGKKLKQTSAARKRSRTVPARAIASFFTPAKKLLQRKIREKSGPDQVLQRSPRKEPQKRSDGLSTSKKEEESKIITHEN
jgi:hypothetical protein